MYIRTILHFSGAPIMTSRRTFLTLSAGAAVAVVATTLIPGLTATPASAQTAPVYLTRGLAVGGYDPVAYFTENKPVQGNPAITLDHGGAKYQFANEANRDAFKKEPDKYAPQYGGYCAWAVAQGYTAHGDPNAWTINNGKLFLNYNRSVHATWTQDIPGNVTKADANWPKLIGQK
jgi:YHS domain-containing protein